MFYLNLPPDNWLSNLLFLSYLIRGFPKKVNRTARIASDEEIQGSKDAVIQDLERKLRFKEDLLNNGTPVLLESEITNSKQRPPSTETWVFEMCSQNQFYNTRNLNILPCQTLNLAYCSLLPLRHQNCSCEQLEIEEGGSIEEGCQSSQVEGVQGSCPKDGVQREGEVLL